MRKELAKLGGPETTAGRTAAKTPKLNDEAPTVTAPVPRSSQVPSSRAFPVAGWERYERIEFLGAGGMGKVFKAEDPRLGRMVALKLLRDSDPELIRKLLREARAQARIEHEHICKVFEAGEVGGHPYIAMQYIKGRSLKELKRELTLEQKVAAIRDVAEALHAAHRAGLIHRDIKPANIMVEQGEDGRLHPYVMDFGIAREVDRAGQTMSGLVEGTPSYMAPEQARGEGHKLDRRTDVYSLGATLYDLLAGRPPFIGETSVDVLVALALEEPLALRKLDAGIPVDLETIVMKCLEKEPANRYDSAKALADDLGRYLAGEPIGARPATLGYLLAKKARKHKLGVALGAAAVMVALGLGGAWLNARLQVQDQARLAQRLGQDVKEMELFLRYAYALPLHDAGREKAVIRARMSRLAAQAAELRGLGEGPLHYALGRGHLALHEPKEAIVELEKAISAGYRTPEVELSMGLAMGELYKRALDEAQRIPDTKLRDARRKEVEAQHLVPTLKHLTASNNAEVESPRYVEALIAFYSKKHDEALAKAREAFAESPWLYEAKKLEGDILRIRGDEKSNRGDYDSALDDYTKAAGALREAAQIARSDASVHEAEADVWSEVIDVYRWRGSDPQAIVPNVISALDNFVAADPGAKSAHTKKGLAHMRLGLHQASSGNDPSIAMARAIEAAELAVRADPDDALAHDILGIAHLEIARHQMRDGQDPRESIKRSISSFKEAIRADSAFAWAWNDLGTAQLSLAIALEEHGVDPRDGFKQAIYSLTRAAEVNPGYAAAPSNICYVFWRQARYELTHGVDPAPSAEAAIAGCRAALSLNPSYGDAYDNLALIHIVNVERAVFLGEDPTEHLALAKEAASKAVELIPTGIEIGQNLIRAYLLEAVHLLNSRRDPSPALAKANTLVNDLRRLTPKNAASELLNGKLELVAARAATANGADPEAHLTAARASFERAAGLNPKDAEVYHATAELFHSFAEHRARKQKPQALELIERGLEQADKSLSLNPGMPAVIATKGALHLLRAHVAPKAADRAEAARRAEAALAGALRSNPFLKREFSPLLEEAQFIAKNAGAAASK
jgi:serine/threonine-protein kinase